MAVMNFSVKNCSAFAHTVYASAAHATHSMQATQKADELEKPHLAFTTLVLSCAASFHRTWLCRPTADRIWRRLCG